MTDVRRLAARLGPASPNLTGNGGIPEWTQQDVAAGLGMMRDSEGEPIDDLAREVFCAIYAQEFARLTEPRLLQLIAVRQFEQLMRQLRRLAELQGEVVVARDAFECAKALSIDTKTHEEELRYVDARLLDCEKQRWSIKTPEMFGIVRKAVLSEVSKPNLCDVCYGRMSIWRKQLQVKCQRCEGRGVRGVSDRQRAAKIRRDESNYRREWRFVYEFTYREVADAEATAVYSFMRALGIEDGYDVRYALGASGAEPAESAAVAPPQ